MKEYLKGSLVIEGIFKIYESNGSLQNKICRKYLRYKPFLKSAPLQKFQNFLGSFIFNYVYFHFMSKNMFWGRESEKYFERTNPVVRGDNPQSILTSQLVPTTNSNNLIKPISSKISKAQSKQRIVFVCSIQSS